MQAIISIIQQLQALHTPQNWVRSFHLPANLGENYNVNTGAISLDLPSVSLSSTQFYPFRKKKSKRSFKMV